METYLIVDVPAFARSHYNADISQGRMAIAGISEGGMCAMMVTLRHPQLFTTFGEYSGLTGPTVSEVIDAAATTAQLFDRSTAAYQAHDPLNLLRIAKYPGVAGWYEVGTADSGPLQAQRTLGPLAVAAGLQTCSVEVPGGAHDYDLWARAFKDSLPWLAYRLGLTGPPATEPGPCMG